MWRAVVTDFLSSWARLCLGSVAGAALGAASFCAIEALPSAATTVEEKTAWATWYLSGVVHCLVNIGEVSPEISEETTKTVLRERGYSTDYFEKHKDLTLPAIAKRISQALGHDCKAGISEEDMKRKIQLAINDMSADMDRQK